MAFLHDSVRISILKRPMGRQDDFIKHTAVAKILGVSKVQLRRMAANGVIYPAQCGSHCQEALYRPEEVYALLELRGRRLHMPSIATMAMQAQALSRTTAKRLDKLCKFIGVENNRLHHDEESVFNLYVRVRETLSEDLTTMRTATLIDWASVFNSIDEIYLGLVEHYTLSDSPWELYLQLANNLMAYRNPNIDTNLSFAYACLDSSRRNLRHVAYFYTSTKYGHQVAEDLFTKDASTEEIIAQLYPRSIEPT